jgi:hypothetical protein
MKKQTDWEQRRYEIAMELVRDILDKTPDNFVMSSGMKHRLEWAMAQADTVARMMKEEFERLDKLNSEI